MMKIQCDCGEFEAELTGMPKNTPGRLMCYCDNCQDYAQKIGREDILDENGGTEVVPVYPSEFTISKGANKLKCNRLSPNGLNRWTVECCNSPIANTKPGFPWVGIPHTAYKASDANSLTSLGPIKSSIMGKYAKGELPAGVPDKFNMKAMLTVMPFILKGKLTGKSKSSPFFCADGKTPTREVNLLSR